jgi:hypothetical protein
LSGECRAASTSLLVMRAKGRLDGRITGRTDRAASVQTAPTPAPSGHGA